MSDGQAVTATLTRARRRLMAATFVRWTCWVLALGIAGLVLTTLLAGRPFAPGRPLAIVAATALALAVMITAWRRPTLAQTAAALDTRLGLADLAVAAHALRDSPHPMAQLVLRDARQRLGSASMVRVLPMPRRLATWTSGGSIAALLLGVLAGGGSAPAGNLVPAGGTGRVVAGGGSAAQRTGTAAATPATAPGGRTLAPRSEPDTGTSPNRSLPLETPSAGGSAIQPAAASRGQQPGAGGSDGAAAARGRAAARSGNAGRGAADPLAAPGSAAGGVQQGTVARSTPPPLQGVAAPPTTGEIRQAAQRAEAALARDEIPPRMKPLVRRYFQSMRSESR